MCGTKGIAEMTYRTHGEYFRRAWKIRIKYAQVLFSSKISVLNSMSKKYVYFNLQILKDEMPEYITNFNIY